MTRSLLVALCAVLGLPACGGESRAQSGDAAGGDTLGDSACTAATGAADATRAATAGNTEISVTLVPSACATSPGRLELRVSMTNHTCNIPGYDLDLDQHAAVVTSDGATVTSDFTYEVLSADDHHPLSILGLADQREGQPLVGCATEWVELQLAGIDLPPGEAVSFSWSGSALEGWRDCP